MKVKVITDSTSYIPSIIRNKYDIEIVSLSVILGNKSIKEVNIDQKTFYKTISESDKLPTSSQPSVGEIYDVFEKHVLNGEAIVAIFISSEMSGTYSNANLAKQMILSKYENASIEIIDSTSNCMQLGFAVIAAARAAKAGKSLDEIVNAAKNNINKSRFLFIPDTLEYLKKGGRIGSAASLIGSILRIKPILTVKNKKTCVFSKVRTKKRAIAAMVETLLEDSRKHGLENVVVHHINCEEEAKKLANLISDKIGKVVDICSIGPVIGLHVGPGALGIVYSTAE